jgi:hypothetical protein
MTAEPARRENSVAWRAIAFAGLAFLIWMLVAGSWHFLMADSSADAIRRGGLCGIALGSLLNGQCNKLRWNWLGVGVFLSVCASGIGIGMAGEYSYSAFEEWNRWILEVSLGVAFALLCGLTKAILLILVKPLLTDGNPER